jgi:spermidine/putrescine-binding protein
MQPRLSNPQSFFSRVACGLAVAVLLSGCGGGATPTPAASQAHVTGTGFVCPEPAPRMEVTSTELNLFVWTEYIPQDIIDCFELVYGITVNRDEFSSNEEMYAKLTAGAATYDLTQPSDYIIAVMIRNELLQKLAKDRLPNLSSIDPAYLPVPGDDTGEYVVPYQAGTQAIVYDSAAVGMPPTSWKDLWNPDYAGRMVFVDDMRSVIGVVLLAEGLDPNTTDPAALEFIKPRLQELVNGVKLFDSDSPKTALIAGDADIGYVWNAEAELAYREKDTIRYVFPDEGAILFQDGYVILNQAPHLDAAYAWLNYSLQGDVFWLMLRDFPYTNPNKAALEYAKNATFTVKDGDGNDVTPAELYDAYISSPITNTPPEAWAAGHSIVDVGEATPLYDQLWTEVKGGS